MGSLRRKLSLLATIGLSLVSVSTAAVSTFAWFQANAQVNVSTTSSYTSITVNKPDEYIFYGYKGNIDTSYGATGTFTSDFVELTSPALVTQYTTLNSMCPGDIYVFAVKVTNAKKVSLVLNKFISNNATKQGLNQAVLGSTLSSGEIGIKGVQYYTRTSSSAGKGYLNDGSYSYTKSFVGDGKTEAESTCYSLSQLGGERYYYGQSEWKMNVGYAIDIFTTSYAPTKNTLPTGYSSFLTSTIGSDLFNYSISTEAHRTLLDSNASGDNSIVNNITFFNNNDLSASNDLYILWSVVYSEASALLFNEVDSSGHEVKTEQEGNRYFVQNEKGSSNCFAGLNFALSKFTLTIG